MLARENRVIQPAEFRAVVRRGRRLNVGPAVYYRLATQPDAPARFGFIVSRAVGNAVERNLLRRRMRAVARGLVDAGAHGADVVVRALPGCADRGFARLAGDMHDALDEALLGDAVI